ncbi:MAG: alpha/beta fold hydrolase [Planctomycetota bacterium]
MRLFSNRSSAAEELAGHLAFLRNEDPIVLGLANGGIPVAEIIARQLDAPLDVMLIERLAAPGPAGRTVGAVDEHGRISMIKSSARWHHVTSQEMVGPARIAFRSLQRKQGRIRSVLSEIEVRDRTVIIADEGVASGARLLGAIASVRDRGARKIAVAVPAGTSDATWQLHDAADIVVIPHRPSKFRGIDSLYAEYLPVTDDMVVSIIERWASQRPAQQPGVRTLITKVKSSLDKNLCCSIDLPPGAGPGSGPFPAVVFAHGYDSDGNSPRNVVISRRLAKRGIIGIRLNYTGHGASEGTLEEATPTQCLQDLDRICQTVYAMQEVDPNRFGLLGSGMGGMFVLHYAARVPQIRSLVIRDAVCGDETSTAERVHASTLLIHAEFENSLAAGMQLMDQSLAGPHELITITDCNRLFSDPISRELMVNASVEWLADHLVAIPPSHDQPTTDVSESSSAPPASG